MPTPIAIGGLPATARSPLIFASSAFMRSAGSTALARVIGLVAERAEDGHQPVAEKLVQHAALLEDRVHHLREVLR